MFEILDKGLFFAQTELREAPLWSLLLVMLVAYLLGSINSAVLVSRILYRADIRTQGSGNAGLTNMFRVYGKRAALFTLLGDILKTVLSILVAAIFFGFWYSHALSVNYFCYIAALFCVIGHIKPIYYGFRGGKGVLCTAVAVLVLAPPVFGVLFAAFVLIVWATRYISLGSIVTAGLLPLTLQAYMQIIMGDDTYNPLIVLFGFVFTVIVVYCHRANLGRLWRHEENKFSFHRKKTDGEDDKK